MRRALVLLKWSAALLALGVTTNVLVAWGLAAFLPAQDMTSRFWREHVRIGFSSVSMAIQAFDRPGMCRRQYAFHESWSGPVVSAGPTELWKAWSTRREPIPLDDAHPGRTDGGWGTIVERVASLGGLHMPMEQAMYTDGNPTTREQKAAWLSAAVAHVESLAAVEDARGFPFLALWCRVEGNPPPGQSGGPGAWGCIPFTRPGTPVGDARALPLRPIPLGFAANTAVYMLAWSLLAPIAMAIHVVRGRRWRARGRCPGCGYDLSGGFDGGCSECGWGR